MCLISEAARERDLTQAFGRRQHQYLRPLDPHFNDISMWGFAEAVFEGATEIAGA
jgi:hypothetical protein